VSYNGSGTFNINSAGQPVVTGTVITSTAFNALTADLATGLSTALTKDGQTTPTANIPMGTYKITGLGAGTVATDAVRLSQLQSGGTTTYITAAGTDTITGTVTPALTAYATGQQFSFVVAATNTTAVTLNIDSVGAKAVTMTGAVALVAGDMITGQVVIVEYDGTRFQLINGNNLKVAGTTSGIATIVAPAVAGTPTLTLPTLTGTVGLATRTVQVFTSGSGTYTTPTGCKAIFIRCVGGGGGGAGAGTGAGAGGSGGSTTFSTLTAAFGTGGQVTGGGGDGGVGTNGDVNVRGGFGGFGGGGATQNAGGGGSTPLGCGGGVVPTGGYNGTAAAGYGAAGGGASSPASGSGGGGGAGGYVEKLISSPAATYSYAIGAAGAAGAGGTVGAAGTSGVIIVTESY
jgi:hypothetical protein